MWSVWMEKMNFMERKICILFRISLKFASGVLIGYKSELNLLSGYDGNYPGGVAAICLYGKQLYPWVT